ncbi:signal peptidase I [Leifsonia xyli subsp. cynodontis DSM 46306]|jgi:signal peptidase|uniref:Signal peptidase I n=1 Tax=Leifsonia xyli subsp. cynodontis DSM 46306 TaxID=1389489 RepID=U3P501_LEIXC|nr:signal peptidase I [Leifsonia xyli]AGW40534.1 signal peptidase I [Leifsonia xyli subsp. cynodontis DSM 46306]
MTSVTLTEDPFPTQDRRRSVSHRVRPLLVLRSIVLWLAAIVGAASIVIVSCCALFQLRPEVVVSGSMEPALPVGSLVLATETPGAELRPGDIVTVARPGGRGLVTHRVVSTEFVDGRTSIVLKGDANASPDPEPYLVSSAGKVVATLPVAGYVAAVMKTPLGIATIVVLVGVVIALGFGGRRKA